MVIKDSELSPEMAPQKLPQFDDFVTILLLSSAKMSNSMEKWAMFCKMVGIILRSLPGIGCRSLLKNAS